MGIGVLLSVRVDVSRLSESMNGQSHAYFGVCSRGEWIGTAIEMMPVYAVPPWRERLARRWRLLRGSKPAVVFDGPVDWVVNFFTGHPDNRDEEWYVNDAEIDAMIDGMGVALAVDSDRTLRDAWLEQQGYGLGPG